VQEKGIAPVPLSGLRFSALTVSDLLGADPAPSARQRDAQ
jgi:hypothetical protein